jgi:hypothetical protein
VRGCHRSLRMKAAFILIEIALLLTAPGSDRVQVTDPAEPVVFGLAAAAYRPEVSSQGERIMPIAISLAALKTANGAREITTTGEDAEPLRAAEILHLDYVSSRNGTSPFHPLTRIESDLMESEWVALGTRGSVGRKDVAPIKGSVAAGRRRSHCSGTRLACRQQ